MREGNNTLIIPYVASSSIFVICRVMEGCHIVDTLIQLQGSSNNTQTYTKVQSIYEG